MTPDQQFEEIESLLRMHAADAHTAGPKGDVLIRHAETFLGVTFPPSYREFLKRWGALGFGPEEIYGITGENFETAAVPNGIWFTAQERTRYGLPSSLVVVVNDNGDQYFCIDTARRSADGESPVVVWDVSSGSILGTKSASFGDFLLTRLQEAAEIIDAD
jgi:SMI1-KNR4 cell-wall